MKSKNVVFCLCAASVTSLLAHDLYIMPGSFRVVPGQSLTIELHNGDAFPESEGPPAAARLTNTRLLGKGKDIELKDFREENKALVTRLPIGKDSAGTLILTATLIPNSREYDAKKFRAYLEDEGLVMVAKYLEAHGDQKEPIKELYSKYAKSLVVSGKPSSVSTRALGLKMEIVPTVDPATLKPGMPLPVRVLYEGKPAGGLTIETTWTTGESAKPAVVGQTDKEGRISIPLRNGKCRITTGYSQRYRDQTVANWETFFATLTFEVIGQ
jgi:uncharacterized GH25 family protein